ncbi:glucose PTS transporter subunit IIA [Mycoplasmopsis caviae]|uniref:PTS system, glucose/glucosamine/beta-glucoside-specific, IICBA component n=1 Tax=Mycoplasmopsis caviae TaxID=55603 RepID=A0A3P8LB27_9BACT|nr:glucose PTS transporter subunit IIA [Mycoplasmopsis caviae]VDR42181.1 PTS system, glucose/glucosamine/beta-glucoside-specific, IICBA component [Mycoplasmopsis caviae]
MGLKNWFKNLFARGDKNKQQPALKKNVEVSQMSRDIVEAMGGIKNITGFNNCAARLRYDVKDTSLVNEEELKKIGASEVIFIGKRHVQAKFGEVSEKLNIDIQAAIPTLEDEERKKKVIEVSSDVNLFEEKPIEVKKSKDDFTIYAPCIGTRKSLEDLSDSTFSLLGSGYAVELDSKLNKIEIYAPISGTLIMTYPTKHAYGIVNESGLEVLVHIGIDTVKLNGLGFETNLKQNDKVEKGQLLATVDLKKLKNSKICSDVIILITDNENKTKQTKLLCTLEIKEAKTPWFKMV